MVVSGGGEVFQLSVRFPWGHLWKYVRKGWPTPSSYPRIRWDSSRENFWQDLCCGENPFAMCFLGLFRICCDKWASVVDLMKLTNGILH